MGAAQCSLAWLTVVLSGAGIAPAAIHFEDFASIRGLSLVGDAAVSGTALRLTRAKGDRSGAVWFSEKHVMRLWQAGPLEILCGR